MHVWNAVSHLALSSPRRVVPMTHASRLDEQLEKSGCRCDDPGFSAPATVIIAIKNAGIAAATLIFGMAHSLEILGQTVFHGPSSAQLTRPPQATFATLVGQNRR